MRAVGGSKRGRTGSSVCGCRCGGVLVEAIAVDVAVCVVVCAVAVFGGGLVRQYPSHVSF